MAGKVVWERRQRQIQTERSETTSEWAYEPRDGEYENQLASRHAGTKWPTMGGVELREHFNFPGGPGFGVEHLPKEERRWPAVTLIVRLPVGRLDLRDELTSKLRALTEEFLEQHGLLDEVP